MAKLFSIMASYSLLSDQSCYNLLVRIIISLVHGLGVIMCHYVKLSTLMVGHLCVSSPLIVGRIIFKQSMSIQNQPHPTISQDSPARDPLKPLKGFAK